MPKLLRVQKYADDIGNIIEKTQSYCKELTIVGKYLSVNVKNNIKNYLDMASDKKELTKEELIILIREFDKFMDMRLVEEYFKED